MAALLGTVTLADWRDVITGALNAAKSGDARARAWLAQHLVGKPEGKAPTPPPGWSSKHGPRSTSSTPRRKTRRTRRCA
jgi:hypothetical protein